MQVVIFQSTSSARRTTFSVDCKAITGIISIHVLREEDDKSAIGLNSFPSDFNPRPPRGGRLCRTTRRESGCAISIHVLREEDDLVMRY